MKQRLDKLMLERGMVASRSEASNWIKLAKVYVNGNLVTKSGYLASQDDIVSLRADERYVSRAGLKLASVAKDFNLDFRGKTVLDIGSSTGGFTDYALQHGAKKIFAVDVGTDQLNAKLRLAEKIELHEKTDIRDFYTDEPIDIIVGDVSFISLREILPHVAQNLMRPDTILVAMLKPQFEAGKQATNKGVVKNSKIRRQILTNFEEWSRQYFVILDKKDSDVSGAKGNLERFYKLRLPKRH